MNTPVLSVLSGATGMVLMWLLAGIGTNNLHTGASLIVVLLIMVGGLTAATAGWLISRRSGEPRAVLFGATAGAVSGAICGGSYFLVMGIAYVGTFGGAPVSFTDALIVILAYPVFTALGLLVGSLPGAALGAGLAFIAQRTRPGRPITV